FTTSFALDGSADGLHTVRFVATDKAGNMASPASVSFTLNSAVAVANFDPADGEQDVLTTRFVTVTFTQPVQIKPPTGVTTPPISVSAEGTAVSGRAVLDNTGTRLIV